MQLRTTKSFAPLLAGCVLFLSGCASTHDLSSGPGLFGGGVAHEEINPGLFRIQVQTNVTPWSREDAARELWADVAKQVCPSGKWKEFAIKEDSYDPTVYASPIKHVSNERSGYALCEGAKTTEEEADKIVKQREAW